MIFRAKAASSHHQTRFQEQRNSILILYIKDNISFTAHPPHRHPTKKRNRTSKYLMGRDIPTTGANLRQHNSPDEKNRRITATAAPSLHRPASTYIKALHPQPGTTKSLSASQRELFGNFYLQQPVKPKPSRFPGHNKMHPILKRFHSSGVILTVKQRLLGIYYVFLQKLYRCRTTSRQHRLRKHKYESRKEHL